MTWDIAENSNSLYHIPNNLFQTEIPCEDVESSTFRHSMSTNSEPHEEELEPIESEGDDPDLETTAMPPLKGLLRSWLKQEPVDDEGDDPIH